jgi:hypothetical protein
MKKKDDTILDKSHDFCFVVCCFQQQTNKTETNSLSKKELKRKEQFTGLV